MWSRPACKSTIPVQHDRCRGSGMHRMLGGSSGPVEDGGGAASEADGVLRGPRWEILELGP